MTSAEFHALQIPATSSARVKKMSEHDADWINVRQFLLQRNLGLTGGFAGLEQQEDNDSSGAANWQVDIEAPVPSRLLREVTA